MVKFERFLTSRDRILIVRKRNHVKRLPKDWGQNAIGPNRVREHEIQQKSFLPGISSLEQFGGTGCQFEQGHSVVHVLLIGPLVLFDVLKVLPLCSPPLRRFGVKEAGVYPAVKFVHVHLLNPPLQSLVFTLAAIDSITVELLLVAVAVRKGGDRRWYCRVRGVPWR